MERLIGFGDEVYATLQPARDSSGVTARSARGVVAGATRAGRKLTRESGEATLRPMPRSARRPAAVDPVPESVEHPEPDQPAPITPAAAAAGSLADLPVAGLTRRRIALRHRGAVRRVGHRAVRAPGGRGQRGGRSRRRDARRQRDSWRPTSGRSRASSRSSSGRPTSSSRRARTASVPRARSRSSWRTTPRPSRPDAPGSAAVRLGAPVAPRVAARLVAGPPVRLRSGFARGRRLRLTAAPRSPAPAAPLPAHLPFAPPGPYAGGGEARRRARHRERGDRCVARGGWAVIG